MTVVSIGRIDGLAAGDTLDLFGLPQCPGTQQRNGKHRAGALGLNGRNGERFGRDRERNGTQHKARGS